MFRYLMTIGWLCVVGSGMWWLNDYANTPATRGSVPLIWPAETQVDVPLGKPLLVMFVHPRCPCTLASVRELEPLVARHREQIALVATIPNETSGQVESAWTTSDVYRWADRMGVRVILDPGGRESKLFGAHVSGFCTVYDASGQLRFSGGVTASRGHAGPNSGADTVASLLAGKASLVNEHDVFGCGLVQESDIGELR